MTPDTEDAFNPNEAERQLEAMIFAAKDFVVPSEHFRPVVQEAAREQGLIRAQERRIGKMIIGLILGSCCCSLAWPTRSNVSVINPTTVHSSMPMSK
jgi:hypothetical protein